MRRKLILILGSAIALVHAQTPGTRPAFEAATIKPNADCGNGRGGPMGGGPMGPGRLSMGCTTVQMLVQLAYGSFANGARPDPRRLQVVGAPEWVESDHFDVVAKAEGDADLTQMAGPMMQTLLEDRLKLKIHRETRDLPIYALIVAKGGSKLQSVKEGSCTPIDLSHLPAGPPAPGQMPNCGRANSRRNGAEIEMNVSGMSAADFSGQILSGALDRPVFDKTGLSGLFDFHLHYALDNPGTSAAASDLPGLSIFTAVQDQLGLKLSPETGPLEVLVVDHVEKPSAN